MKHPQAGWNLDHSYTRLTQLFFARQNPIPVRAPKLVQFNFDLARSLGLDATALANDGVDFFAGNRLPPGADSIAQAYAGHQFGHLTMLGDGRAVLLGEQITPTRNRFDVQLKGSGQTPFSRRGDGRAALGPMLREYIISEAMAALGIPTTRSLAVVSTGEPVIREADLPGAVLTRVAQSHIRIGTFVYAAAAGQGSDAPLRELANYTILRHYPELVSSSKPDAETYQAFLRAVIDRQASLVTQWMQVGFIHGVMNTDNVAISGETIDYGPCAFMDAYSPKTVFSSIDRNGRYAFGEQSKITAWNLARFAETLIPLLADTPEMGVKKAEEALDTFSSRFQHYSNRSMRAKLGIAMEEPEDLDLISSLLRWMEDQNADYTNTFRALSNESAHAHLPFQSEPAQRWLRLWKERLNRQGDSKETTLALMKAHNPSVIPRNHRVEEALEAATARSDFSVIEKLLQALKSPYKESSAQHAYQDPDPSGSAGYRTFCGT